MTSVAQKIALDSKGRPGNRITGSNSPPYKQTCRLIDLTSYKAIRFQNNEDGDGDGMVVIAQAIVTMEELVRECLKRNVLPKVVAEFRQITVGGAISGAVIESSSHRYGLFMDTVKWIQVLLPSTSPLKEGEQGNSTDAPNIVTTKRGETLWRSVSGSYGCFGIVLEAAIECIPVSTPYVQISYYCYSNNDNNSNNLQNNPNGDKYGGVGDACSSMIRRAKKDPKSSPDFLDAIQFPPEQLGITQSATTVVMEGRLCTVQPTALSSFRTQCRGASGLFYFEHVRNIVQQHSAASTETFPAVNSNDKKNDTNHPDREEEIACFEEGMPIEDYLFRYDDGAFWMARPMVFQWKHFWSYLPFTLFLFLGSSRPIRYVLTGSLLAAKKLYRALKLAPSHIVARKIVIQDLVLPTSNNNNNNNHTSTMAVVEEFVSRIRTKIPLSTPLWLCLIRKPSIRQPFSPSQLDDSYSNGTNEYAINCGVYGRVSDNWGTYYTQQLEKWCRELRGRKMLYAQNWYSQELFWSIYDHDEYKELRKKLEVENIFPDLYEKVCPHLEEKECSWLKETIAALLL